MEAGQSKIVKEWSNEKHTWKNKSGANASLADALRGSLVLSRCLIPFVLGHTQSPSYLVVSICKLYIILHLCKTLNEREKRSSGGRMLSPV